MHWFLDSVAWCVMHSAVIYASFYMWTAVKSTVRTFISRRNQTLLYSYSTNSIFHWFYEFSKTFQEASQCQVDREDREDREDHKDRKDCKDHKDSEGHQDGSVIVDQKHVDLASSSSSSGESSMPSVPSVQNAPAPDSVVADASAEMSVETKAPTSVAETDSPKEGEVPSTRVYNDDSNDNNDNNDNNNNNNGGNDNLAPVFDPAESLRNQLRNSYFEVEVEDKLVRIHVQKLYNHLTLCLFLLAAVAPEFFLALIKFTSLGYFVHVIESEPLYNKSSLEDFHKIWKDIENFFQMFSINFQTKNSRFMQYVNTLAYYGSILNPAVKESLLKITMLLLFTFPGAPLWIVEETPSLKSSWYIYAGLFVVHMTNFFKHQIELTSLKTTLLGAYNAHSKSSLSSKNSSGENLTVPMVSLSPLPLASDLQKNQLDLAVEDLNHEMFLQVGDKIQLMLVMGSATKWLWFATLVTAPWSVYWYMIPLYSFISTSLLGLVLSRLYEDLSLLQKTRPKPDQFDDWLKSQPAYFARFFGLVNPTSPKGPKGSRGSAGAGSQSSAEFADSKNMAITDQVKNYRVSFEHTVKHVHAKSAEPIQRATQLVINDLLTPQDGILKWNMMVEVGKFSLELPKYCVILKNYVNKKFDEYMQPPSSATHYPKKQE